MSSVIFIAYVLGTEIHDNQIELIQNVIDGSQV